MKNTIKIATLLVTAFLVASCSNKISVAEVDGLRITADDIKNEVQFEKGKFDQILLGAGSNLSMLKKNVLEKLVQEKILLSEAKRQGIEISKDEMENFIQKIISSGALDEAKVKESIWKKRQKDRLVIQKLINEKVLKNAPISQPEIKKYYAAHKNEFLRPMQFHARQIVVDTKELADEILKKLREGGDFEALAKEYSLSPDRDRGGDIGFFDSKTFPGIFTEICSKLKINEISEVVVTDYGYQIFQLLEKRPSHQVSEENAAEEITQRIKEEKSEKLFADWFSSLRGNAKITVNEKALEEVNVE